MKPASSPRRRDSAAQLLDAASRILAERSVVEITLSEVAAAAKLNSALVKYHFRNKEGLLLALARRDAGQALAQLQSLVAMQLPPEQKLRIHVLGIINTYARYPYLNRLLHELLGSQDEEVVRQLNAFFVKPLATAQGALLRQGVEAGVFREIAPMHFHLAVVGACDQFFYSAKSLQYAFGAPELSSGMREDYAEFVVEMALRALRKE
ncbi:MAG: TetR/AcrR family transcriptional regulator [Proteobacteria bacterium]|nr:TetR/AcrR family transcriptional regulator [Pseudomonadota bacterium]MBU6426184.1 TetR/AcrR family transcriptional regulator [Rhodospirillales bacterium]